MRDGKREKRELGQLTTITIPVYFSVHQHVGIGRAEITIKFVKSASDVYVHVAVATYCKELNMLQILQKFLQMSASDHVNLSKKVLSIFEPEIMLTSVILLTVDTD